MPSRDYFLRHSPSGFSNSQINLSWFTSCMLPFLNNLRTKYNYSGPAILILDGFSGHKMDLFKSLAANNKIILIQLPAHSSHLTQPLDLLIFGAMKTYYKTTKCDSKIYGESSKLIRAIKSHQLATISMNVKSAFSRAGIQIIETDTLPLISIIPSKVIDISKIEIIDENTKNDGKVHVQRSKIEINNPFISNYKELQLKSNNLCPLCGQLNPITHKS